MGIKSADSGMFGPLSEELLKSNDIFNLLEVINVNLKENWGEFRKVIIENGIKNLYHFTDYENLASIKEHGGLYSWGYCELNNIDISQPGGNELSRDLDQRYQLENYVRLSFQQFPPLLYTFKKNGRIKNPISFIVDPSVIYWENTKFSDENATANDAIIGGDLLTFNAIQFEKAMRSYNYIQDGIDLRFFQAEVLVEEHIPIKYIKQINRLNI